MKIYFFISNPFWGFLAELGFWELVMDVCRYFRHILSLKTDNSTKRWLQPGLGHLYGSYSLCDWGAWTAAQTGCKYVRFDQRLKSCVQFSWWNQTTWRLPQHGGFVASLSLVSTASASFHSCGRQYRKVWKVAIETASAEQMQGPFSSTQRRSWLEKAAPDFIIFYKQASVADSTSWSRNI